MRAIDADALQLAIVEEGQANKRKKYVIGDIWELTGAEIRDVINSQPTIQLDIVRCEDCKHYRHGLCMKASMCVNKSKNGFCDWAERRKDG